MKFRRGVTNFPVLILSVFGVFVLLFGGSFIYFSVNGKDYSSVYLEKIEAGEIKNPVTELSLVEQNSEDEQIEFEKEVIRYFLINLKAYNLHDIPYTSVHPIIEIYIDNNKYFVEIVDGEMVVEKKEKEIFIGEANIEDRDISIKTTKEELAKIFSDSNYVKESYSSGKLSVELTANKFVLFSKGYLTLYKELGISG